MQEKVTSVLAVSGLTRRFGGLSAVSQLDFEIRPNEILGLIGPNGAGKSTVLNMIGGTLSPSEGRVFFEGADVTHWPAYRRARKGIARVYQRDLVFRNLTALDNVLTGSLLHSYQSPVEVFYKSAKARRREEERVTQAMDLLRFAQLECHAHEVASNLPHGKLRRLCLAVALAVRPVLLLLDEPLTGMNAEEMQMMVGLIRRLRDEQSIACLIIEHNIKQVVDLCDRIVVINFGKKLCEGLPRAVCSDSVVIEAYLGANRDVV